MMDTTDSLTPDSLRTFNRWHWIILFVLSALLLLLPVLAGIGPNSYKECVAAPVAAASAAAPAVAPATVTPAPAPAPAPAAPVTAAEPIPEAKVYFALDKWDLPTDVTTTIAAVVAYLKAHPEAKALVSGFHDPRGSVARNEELAFNRARQVRDALDRAGIPNDRVVMNKPQVTTGTGSNAEARRVEVTIQAP